MSPYLAKDEPYPASYGCPISWRRISNQGNLKGEVFGLPNEETPL